MKGRDREGIEIDCGEGGMEIILYRKYNINKATTYHRLSVLKGHFGKKLFIIFCFNVILEMYHFIPILNLSSQTLINT